MKQNIKKVGILFSLILMTLLSCEKEQSLEPSSPMPNLKPYWKIADKPSSKDSSGIVAPLLNPIHSNHH